MEKSVYPYSFAYASGVDTNELDRYKESMKDNIACKDKIADTIRNNFDGYRLGVDVAKEAIKEFGIDRVNYVLANSIKHKDHDGRISRENKAWAKETFIPLDLIHNQDQSRYFAVDQNGLLDIVVNQFKRAYKELDLWGKEQMNDTKGLDFEDKVMVMNPKNLKDEYKTRDNQLFFCARGIGCMPEKMQGKIYGEHLSDGERTTLYREVFIGEAKPDFLPQWAKDRQTDILTDKEALRILVEFRKIKEPNLYNKTHFAVQIKDKDLKGNINYDKIYHLMPFRSFEMSPMNNDKGIICSISKDEDRNQRLIKPKTSVLKKLKDVKSEVEEKPKEPTPSKNKEVR